MISNKRILVVMILIGGLWLTGIIGYETIEGWSCLDSVYMTAISLTTVGYGEVHPLSTQGRIFTIFLLTLGVGLFFYSLGLMAEAIIEGHVKGYFGKRKMEKAINKLYHHFIICGYGRIGRTIAKEIVSRNLPVVIVENDPEVQKRIEQEKLLHVQGDATHDEILLKAGVKRARSIICVLYSDAANVYITLTARALNPGLQILARADDPLAEKKMIQAGADRVVSPYEIGARRMALAVLKPTVTEFLDLAVHSSAFDLSIEQIEIHQGSDLDSVTPRQVALREKTGVTVLAVQQSTGEMMLTLSPDYTFQAGDIIVALGSRKGLDKVRRLAGCVT